jgi:hypothetical protein
MQIPSMLPLLSSPFLHIFSPAFSERSITSSRAAWQLWLTPRSHLTQVLPPVPVQTRSRPIDLVPRLRWERPPQTDDGKERAFTSFA